MISIVRNRQSRVNTTGFRRVSREGRGWCEADGLVSPAGGRTVAAAVTDAQGMTKRGFARRPDQAGLTFPAGRARPCDRSTARGEPIAVRRGLAYHLEQRAKKRGITERR